jgi:hypothetical protein
VAGRGASDEQVVALVHTHGTRLVRLAYLLDVPEPQCAAADALAHTVLGRRSGDAHDDLITAARHIGARAQPAVYDEALLQGWLDRAERDAHEVDLQALQTATVSAMTDQRARRSTTRRRATAGAVAAVMVVAGAGAVAGEDGPAPAPPAANARLDGYPPPSQATGRPVDVVELMTSRPRRLPPGQRSATGVALADTLLAGPTVRVAPVHVDGARATVIAALCAPRGGPPSLCTLAVPPDDTLRQAAPKHLLATLPLPTGDRLRSLSAPLVSRSSMVDEFKQKTVLWEVTSAKVGTLRVQFADGRSADATRFSHPTWDVALFAVVGDVTPARLWYLTDGMVLDQRSLYTATP